MGKSGQGHETGRLIMSTGGYFELLQRFADDFFEQTNSETATTKDIAVWAIQTGRWDPPSDLILRKCREDFAKAFVSNTLRIATGGRSAPSTSRESPAEISSFTFGQTFAGLLGTTWR